MTAPLMAVVVMMIAAKALAQMHDRSACGGRGLVGHISGLRRHGKGGNKRQGEHSSRDGGCAREIHGWLHGMLF